MKKYFLFALIAISMIISQGCKKSGGAATSSSTGWKYNDQEWGGFERIDYQSMNTGPNLVPIQGGTFTMGLTDEDVVSEWNNIPRRVTVSSFYMDETEVSNIDYREYLFWLQRIHKDLPEVYKSALPDTLVWREELSFNEPLVETYFRHPAYNDYPVVGVNWDQASRFAEWRTDRVNEMILIQKGILNPNPEQTSSENFNTKTYLAGQYQGSVRKNLKDIATDGERAVRFEDGILLPSYRLPTEAEWEYAALALLGNLASEKDELITDKRIYPWDGNTARYKRRNKHQGQILANFKRGRGDYMGLAGKLNDEQPFAGPVRSNYPNDYGLFNMGGNVSEWTADVYRPLTNVTLRDEEGQDLNPYRGNEFKTLYLDENGMPEMDSIGRFKYIIESDSLLLSRENYRKSKVKDYLDGDSESIVYEFGIHTLINNQSRVIKGGSWADRLYWLSPGARRYKDQGKSDRTIGFRCAMTRTGDQFMDEPTRVNEFKVKRKPVRRRYK